MSTSLWPWLAVAAAGALHGLNPCTGWALALACGRGQALQALAAVALGHAASVAGVAAMVALGAEPGVLLPMAVGVLLGALLIAGLAQRLRTGRAAVALGAFVTSTLHGSGLMLVPALVPLCLSASPAREITASGSLVLALAAVSVHMVAMLAVTAGAALVASSCVRTLRRWLARGHHNRSIPLPVRHR
ncbi:hypothetical protein [Roseateles sp. LYH14W]|uniref:Uncharacterized protein n=1 Tax=Pelomonas parva TaxID=3299032 RepID=A0ABW7F0J2_9BURK